MLIKVAFVGQSFSQKRQSYLLNELSKYFLIYALVPNWSEKLKYLGVPKQVLINEKEVKFNVIWHKVLFVDKPLIQFYPTVIFSLYKIKPKIVVLNLYHSLMGILVGIFCKVTRTPFIVISALNPTIKYKKFERFMLRILYLIPDFVVVLTNGMKIKLIEELKVNENKIFIIPESGYNVKESIKENDNNYVTILYTGRHVYEKGLFYLIFAFKKLIDKGYKAKLILCGEGIITDALRKFSTKLGLNELIEFRGYVEEEELQKHFEMSDVIVYPSIKIKNWEEQFGYSVLEGMSNGLATIVTDCGSLPELVGNAGIIVPQRNVERLEEAMEYLIRNKEKLNEYKKLSIERAKEFSLKNVSKKWKNLIEVALKIRK
ncbi:MAG: glycosyltransferase family 4 protein [Thermoproteota archaeon]|nr:glycosyltransferase family 4 protein [Thermoproteota archaeon]